MANVKDDGFTLGDWVDQTPENQQITQEQSTLLLKKGREFCSLCEQVRVPGIVYFVESYVDGTYFTDGHRLLGPMSRATPEYLAADQIMSCGLEKFVRENRGEGIIRLALDKLEVAHGEYMEMKPSYTYKEWSQIGFNDFMLAQEVIDQIRARGDELVDLATEYGTVLGCYAIFGHQSVNGLWETRTLRSTVFTNLNLMTAELLAADYIIREGLPIFVEEAIGQDILAACYSRHEG